MQKSITINGKTYRGKQAMQTRYLGIDAIPCAFTGGWGDMLNVRVGVPMEDADFIRVLSRDGWIKDIVV